MKDKNYWTEFYKSNKIKQIGCSGFCTFIINWFSTQNITIKNVLDAGSGSGRDSYEFSKYHSVVGVDSSDIVPIGTNVNVRFEKGDFITHNKHKYDLVYSRFSFHSITNEDHMLFLDSIPDNTYLAIEARSDKSCDIKEHHGKSHYRNYINITYMTNILKQYNMNILYISEEDNIAKYESENPICIRLICVRRI